MCVKGVFVFSVLQGAKFLVNAYKNRPRLTMIELAEFLHDADGLNKQEVGDFLGSEYAVKVHFSFRPSFAQSVFLGNFFQEGEFYDSCAVCRAAPRVYQSN